MSSLRTMLSLPLPKDHKDACCACVLVNRVE